MIVIDDGIQEVFVNKQYTSGLLDSSKLFPPWVSEVDSSSL